MMEATRAITHGRRTLILGALLIGAGAFVGGCDKKSDEAAPTEIEESEKSNEAAESESDEDKAEGAEARDSAYPTITLSSTAFKDGEPIPTKFTCDGDNISVPLEWSELPEGTRSIAITMHDPDAPNGTVYHWGVWAIPPGLRTLDEGLATDDKVELSDPDDSDIKVAAYQATNISKKTGYTGPCPPEGDEAHRYIFEIFALDEVGASFSETPTVQALLDELRLDAHATGQLVGIYQREK